MYEKIKKLLQSELQTTNRTAFSNGKNYQIVTSRNYSFNRRKSTEFFILTNYLGLSSHPEVLQAAKDTMNTPGFGMSSVRLVCKTQDIYKTV
jgi:glycine C-acetyltransferase